MIPLPALQHRRETPGKPQCSTRRERSSTMHRILGALSALLFVAGCAGTADETRIREGIAAMAAAVEARNPSDFMEHVAADFIGNSGQYDRDRLERLLRVLVIGGSAPRVSIGTIDIAITGERATVSVTATISGSQRWLRGGGGHIDIVSGWRIEGGEWRCYNATWSGDAVERLSRVADGDLTGAPNATGGATRIAMLTPVRRSAAIPVR
jgi:hypothetical protein